MIKRRPVGDERTSQQILLPSGRTTITAFTVRRPSILDYFLAIPCDTCGRKGRAARCSRGCGRVCDNNAGCHRFHAPPGGGRPLGGRIEVRR
jgi:hypothetical protein